VGIQVKADRRGLHDGTFGIDTITGFDATPSACRVAAKGQGVRAPRIKEPQGRYRNGVLTHPGLAPRRWPTTPPARAAVPRASRLAACFGTSTTAVPQF